MWRGLHKVLIQQGRMPVHTTPCLLQSSTSSQGACTYNLTTFYAALSTLASERPRGHGRSALHHRQHLLEDRNVICSTLFCRRRALMSGRKPGPGPGPGPGPLQEENEDLFPRRKSLLRVVAAPQNGVHELGLDDCPVRSGSIHLIVGPMFAGKTTALLRRAEEEASAGRKIALVKSDKDNRYGLSSIVSHDGKKMPCWAVPNLANFRSQIGEEEYAKLDLIGIDEAQFLKDLCSFCQAAADYEGKILIVAGLDGDFQRNKFGSVLDLVPLADTIVKLSSYCELCGKPAAFTFRKTDDASKEVIGGTDIYMPVCRQHYYSGKVALEATRTVLNSGKIAMNTTRPAINRHNILVLQPNSAEKAANMHYDKEF